MEVKMFIELHMIQNFAPSNLNRDDAGNPKECEFGGYRRARISSQCLKRAIRTHSIFEATTQEPNGKRTKLLADWEQLSDPLLAADKPEEKVKEVTLRFAKAYAKKIESKSRKTNVLIYISPAEIAEAAKRLLERWSDVSADSKDAQKAMDKIANDLAKAYQKITSAPDIALFGRMLADRPETKLDAACQVAHAISTHAVAMEMDFFTAVDDLQPDDDVGAGMMGYIGFNSACFYRYTRIDWQQLVANLQKDYTLARRTVEGFLRAAVRAVPSGMQNSHAALNPPDFLLGVVRNDGMGWSLANAFERPVRPRGDSGLVVPSVQALDAYWGQLCQIYGSGTLTHVAALALDPDLPLENLKGEQVENLEEWIGAVTEALPAEEA
jgi:CRISPR system Cascade subunit CasC